VEDIGALPALKPVDDIVFVLQLRHFDGEARVEARSEREAVVNLEDCPIDVSPELIDVEDLIISEEEVQPVLLVPQPEAADASDEDIEMGQTRRELEVGP